VLFVFGIKFRHELPEGFKRAFGTGMLPIIGINLFIGYLGRGVIDNAAHLGGLVSGALLALAVDFRRPGEKPVVATIWRVLQVAAIALVAISFIKVAQHFRDPQPAFTPPQTAVVDEKTQRFVAYAGAIRDAPEALYAMLKDHDPTRGDAALKNLDAAPELDPTADELKNKLKALLIKAQDIETKRQASSPQSIRDTEAAEQQVVLEFAEWNKQYTAWLKTTGKQYGLVEVTEIAPPEK
jgi:hypothetical protein